VSLDVKPAVLGYELPVPCKRRVPLVNPLDTNLANMLSISDCGKLLSLPIM
jgi:hypothetical protein